MFFLVQKTFLLVGDPVTMAISCLKNRIGDANVFEIKQADKAESKQHCSPYLRGKRGTV